MFRNSSPFSVTRCFWTLLFWKYTAEIKWSKNYADLKKRPERKHNQRTLAKIPVMQSLLFSQLSIHWSKKPLTRNRIFKVMSLFIFGHKVWLINYAHKFDKSEDLMFIANLAINIKSSDFSNQWIWSVKPIQYAHKVRLESLWANDVITQ